MREASALQHLADGAFCRPRHIGMRGGQFHPQLARSPMPALARRDDVPDDLVCELARKMQRHAAAIGEPGGALGPVTREPLVDRLPRHPINLGERGNAFSLVVILNQLDAKIHGSVLLPRHCFKHAR